MIFQDVVQSPLIVSTVFAITGASGLTTVVMMASKRTPKRTPKGFLRAQKKFNPCVSIVR